MREGEKGPGGKGRTIETKGLGPYDLRMECELDVMQQVGLAGHAEMAVLLGETVRLYSALGKRTTARIRSLVLLKTDEALSMKRACFVYLLYYDRSMQEAACAGRFGERRYYPIEPDHLRQFLGKLTEARRDYVCRIPGEREGTRPQDTARRFMDVVRGAVERGGVRGCVGRDDTIRTTIDEL